MIAKRCEITGKISLSEKEATKRVGKAWEYGKFLRAYKCTWCQNSWHLTHTKI